MPGQLVSTAFSMPSKVVEFTTAATVVAAAAAAYHIWMEQADCQIRLELDSSDSFVVTLLVILYNSKSLQDHLLRVPVA